MREERAHFEGVPEWPPSQAAEAIPGQEQETVSDSEFTLFKVGSKGARHPIMVIVEVNGQQLRMEVDTGAAVSVISTATRMKLFLKRRVNKTTAILTTYKGQQMPVAGEMQMKVSYGEQNAVLTLYVVKGQGPSLLGREWLRQIRLDWKSIGMASLTSCHPKIEALLEKYPEVFQEGLGQMNTFKARLHLKADSKPSFIRLDLSHSP